MVPSDLSVPRRFRPALIQLAKLGDDAVAELCSLLEANPDALTARDRAHDIAGQLTKVSADDGARIFDAVIPLLFIRATRYPSASALVKDLTKALKAADKDEEKMPPALASKLEVNLTRLLDLSNVALKSKALSLATDVPRLFTEAKLISDMRPVFGGEVSTPPIGATVLHSLRITFSEDGEEREFFVTLDSKDLRSLQEVVGRAVTKDETLKKFLTQTKLQVFDTYLP